MQEDAPADETGLTVVRPLWLLVLVTALVQPASALAARGDWPMWQHDTAGSRHNPDETAITPSRVGQLGLKWSFAFPNTDAASSQPAVVGDTLYVGGRDGYFYALDARTGALRWRFDTATVTGAPHPAAGTQSGGGAVPFFGNTTTSALLRDGPAVVAGTVYFGDTKANLYALDAATGALRWATKVDDFPDAIVTSSPVVDRGRVFVGVSSGEEAFGLVPAYDCCHFRGSVVALDVASGKIVWRHYTVPPAQRAGTNRFGVPYYKPSGAAVWASPAIDAATHTVFVGTGNPYSGAGAGESDSMLALDEDSGHERWALQLTHGDEWNLDCVFHTTGDCPEPGPDFDFAAAPNVFRIRADAVPRCVNRRRSRFAVRRPRHARVVAITAVVDGRRVKHVRRQRIRSITLRRLPSRVFALRLVERTAGGSRLAFERPYRGCRRGPRLVRPRAPRRRLRTVVGAGQKSGVYHLLDARTGRIVWQTELSKPENAGGPNFQQGVQWGTSYDGRRIYVATAVAHPSRLHALDPASGRVLWQTKNPDDGCTTGGAASYGSDCQIGMPAAVSTSPGLVFEGSLDGKLRAFDADDGRTLWQFDTVRSYTGTNGQTGSGGSISGAGAVVAHGMVYVNSGYNTEESPQTGIHGNVLLAFGLPGTPATTSAKTAAARGPALDRASALRRCVSSWNGERNANVRARLAERTPRAAHLGHRANMLADDTRCLITLRYFGARHRREVQLTLRGARFLPVGEAHVAAPRRTRTWNLSVGRHATVRLRADRASTVRRTLRARTGPALR